MWRTLKDVFVVIHLPMLFVVAVSAHSDRLAILNSSAAAVITCYLCLVHVAVLPRAEFLLDRWKSFYLRSHDRFSSALFQVLAWTVQTKSWRQNSNFSNLIWCHSCLSCNQMLQELEKCGIGRGTWGRQIINSTVDNVQKKIVMSCIVYSI